MGNSCVENKYFSGQGQLLVAERDSNGKPLGFRAIGNSPSVNLAITTAVFEHKESCSGSRGIDYSKTNEVSATLTFDFENFSKENIGIALFGESLLIPAGPATNEPLKLFSDLWQPLPHVQVQVSSVTNLAGDTTYVLDTDYTVNEDSGSIMGIDGGAFDANGVDVLVDYEYAEQDKVEALTSSSAPDRYFRFEGLNTAGDTNKPVVIDLFKISTQPLADWALINEELASGTITGSILSDTLRTTGSKFFSVRKVS